MKVNKTISALALGLGVAAVAQAQTPIYITGSTAFRQQIFNALGDIGLTANTGDSGGNNSFTFHGSISDPHSIGLAQYGATGTNVDVYCTFSGSAEGTQALISQQVNTYEAVGTGSTTSPSGPDIAFSDVQQAVEPDASSPDQLESVQLPADAAIPPFNGIAVQPFAFVGNSNALTAGVSNITSQAFIDLYGSANGELGLGFFNGSTSTNPVRAVGRYNLSGTRITSVLDNGYVIADGLSQWALSPNGTSTPGLASTDSASPVGNQWVFLTSNTNGYFTGGNVGKAIDNGSISNVPPAVGYISFADAQSKLNATRDNVLSWNGESAGTLGSWNIAGVENGQYQFWAYEQLYVNDNDQDTFYDNNFAPTLIAALQYEIVNTTPRTACLESEMNVYRNSDGAVVVHK